MKNLAVALAILVTGVINAQSFTSVKELKKLTPNQLSFLGFEKISKSDSIYFKFWEHNEVASKWINLQTSEIVKISQNTVEYIYNGKVEIEKKRSIQNISYSLLSSIGYGYTKRAFSKPLSVSKEELEISETANIYKRFKSLYVHRALDLENLSAISFIVYL